MSLVRPGVAGSDGSAPLDPLLAEGYERCAELTRRHGTTYYWGARLLPPEQRVDVYAVYALCRLADDIVDEPDTVDMALPAHPDPGVRLRLFEQTFTEALAAEQRHEVTVRQWMATALTEEAGV